MHRSCTTPRPSSASSTGKRFDVILADFVMPTFSGIEALTIASERSPDTPFIFVSGLLGEEHAVDMLKRGATDYVLKQRLQRLPAVVRRAMRESAERAQRIAVERALRETETHFRLLIDALKDYAVITLDPEGRIRTWNAASERILGFPAQDVLGQSASIFYAQEDREAGVFDAELETARREGSASDDRWLWRKDGHSFFASGVTTAIRSEHDELIGFSKIVRDATDAHMAADALRLAKDQAESANRAKDHFLAVLSHELRTPLTPILAAVRLLEMKHSLPREAHPTLDLIRRNVELEARLIDDLLDLTSIARGKLSLNFASVALDTLLTSALDMSEADLRAKDLTLETQFDAAHFVVLGDAARLQQIVWNLMKNAVKFTPAGGRIDVRTWNPDPATIAVSVTDSGIGISAEALPRIFSAFEQADDSITRSFGGLGLGLAIASTLAQKHGGTLSAHSEGRDAGARFTLTLPLASVQPAHEDEPLVEAARQEQRTRAQGAARGGQRADVVGDGRSARNARPRSDGRGDGRGRRSNARRAGRSICSSAISACPTAADSTSRAHGRSFQPGQAVGGDHRLRHGRGHSPLPRSRFSRSSDQARQFLAARSADSIARGAAFGIGYLRVGTEI